MAQCWARSWLALLPCPGPTQSSRIPVLFWTAGPWGMSRAKATDSRHRITSSPLPTMAALWAMGMGDALLPEPAAGRRTRIMRTDERRPGSCFFSAHPDWSPRRLQEGKRQGRRGAFRHRSIRGSRDRLRACSPRLACWRASPLPSPPAQNRICAATTGPADLVQYVPRIFNTLATALGIFTKKKKKKIHNPSLWSMACDGS